MMIDKLILSKFVFREHSAFMEAREFGMSCSSKILVPIGLVFGSDLGIGGISEVLRSCCYVFRTTT